MTFRRQWVVPPNASMQAAIESSRSDHPPSDLPMLSFGQCRAAFSEMTDAMLEDLQIFFQNPSRLVDAMTADEITFAFGVADSGVPDEFLRAEPQTIITALRAEQIEREEQFERQCRAIVNDPAGEVAKADTEILFKFAFAFGTVAPTLDEPPEPLTWEQVQTVAAACLAEITQRGELATFQAKVDAIKDRPL